jgi:hypothetical protein
VEFQGTWMSQKLWSFGGTGCKTIQYQIVFRKLFTGMMSDDSLRGKSSIRRTANILLFLNNDYFIYIF